MQSIHVALGHRQRGDARVAEWSSSLVRIAGGKGGVAVVDVALTCMWREFHTLPLICHRDSEYHCGAAAGETQHPASRQVGQVTCILSVILPLKLVMEPSHLVHLCFAPTSTMSGMPLPIGAR
jgi:hypothetical protein